MASTRDYAQKFAIKFAEATDKKRAVDEITEEINNLVFSISNTGIDYDTKAEIVELIKKFLSREIPLKYADGGKLLIIEQKDNQQFLNMVSYVLSQLKK